MWAESLWNQGMPLLQWSVVIGASFIATCTDLSSRRIPNWLTFPMLLGGLVFAGARAGAPGVFDSLTACVALSLPFILLFLFAQGGAGDAKLMGAIGSWLGLINGLAALAGVALAGIVLAIIYAMIRQQARQVTMNLAGMTQNLLLTILTRGRLAGTIGPETSSQPMLTMPYGVAIFAGVCISALGVLLWQR